MDTSTHNGTNCGSGGATCAPTWRAQTGSAISSTPALTYNQVYVGADDGSVHAWSTLPCASPPCAPAWTAQLDNFPTSSPMVADGLLFVSTQNGHIYALTARGLEVAWSSDVGVSVHSSPVVVNGRIYVGADDGQLHMFGLAGLTAPLKPAISSLASPPTPIRHIVVIYQENHSFDNLLGALCVVDTRCDGAEMGTLNDGTSIPLPQAGDIPSNVPHSVGVINLAIDGGKMDGFSLMPHCEQSNGYRCYEQYQPSQIPNLALLARTYALSDRTFQLHSTSSWGSHIDLAAGQLDGFTGDAPAGSVSATSPGWGCDSNKSAAWRATPDAVLTQIPSCIPWLDGSGPSRLSPAASVPTIMGRLDQAGQTWKIYSGDPTNVPRWLASYNWSICPTFAGCLYSGQAADRRVASAILGDATAGRLPSLSLVQPNRVNSQHNGSSMLEGDNWIASVVSAIQQ
jgi:hypothetical protein